MLGRIIIAKGPFLFGGLSDFVQKSKTPVQALWNSRSIDRLYPSFAKLRMLQNASLVPLISNPIRVNALFFGFS